MESVHEDEAMPGAEDTLRVATTGSQMAAHLSIAGAALFLILLAALHFIKPEVDPSWRMISEYEIGNYGWMMRLAFLSLSFAYLTLLIAVRAQVGTLAGRIGLALLVLGVVGTAMGGVFTSDPITATKDQQTTQGALHGFGALLGIPTLPFAATLLSRDLARNRTWGPARRSLSWATALTWTGLFGFALSMAVMVPRGHGKFTPEVLIGWPNRFLIVTYVVWLITAARGVIKAGG